MERPDHTGIPRDDEPVFTTRRLAELGSYVRAAVGRHRVLFVLVLVATTALGAFVGLSVPKQWDSHARILAQSNYEMPALANPHRTVPLAAEEPLTAVGAYVLTRDNLQRIARDAHLRESLEASRTGLFRLKDRASAWLFGPPSEQDMDDAVLHMLQKRVNVAVGDDGVIDFDASWYDPAASSQIVGMLVDAFLDKRKQDLTGSVSETVSILEGYAKDGQARVAEDLSSLRHARARWARAHNNKEPQPLMASGGKSLYGSTLEKDLAQVDAELDAKRQAITQVETMRAQRLAEVTASLKERSAVLAPGHPEIVRLRQQQKLFQGASPELSQLRSEEAALMARQRSLETRADQVLGRREADRLRTARAALEAVDPSETLDPDVAYARAKLEGSLASYEDMMRRISGARIELDTRRASFPYRYSVLVPPLAPRRPATPGMPIFAFAGLLGGLLLGLTAAVGFESSRGRLLVPWQVERELGLEVLGEVKEA